MRNSHLSGILEEERLPRDKTLSADSRRFRADCRSPWLAHIVTDIEADDCSRSPTERSRFQGWRQWVPLGRLCEPTEHHNSRLQTNFYSKSLFGIQSIGTEQETTRRERPQWTPGWVILVQAYRQSYCTNFDTDKIQWYIRYPRWEPVQSIKAPGT